MSWRTGSYDSHCANNNRARNRNRSTSYHDNYSSYLRNAENDLDWRRPSLDNTQHGNRKDGGYQPKDNTRKVFMIGLRDDDKVAIAITPRCGDLNHSEIISFRDVALNKSFSNVTGLEEELQRQLSYLKRKRCPSVVTMHHGLMHYFRPEGSYDVHRLLKDAHYERLYNDSVNFDAVKKLPCVKELTRFDLQIATPDQDCKLHYQLFVKDRSFIQDIREVDEHLSKFLVPVSLEPGFLIKKSRTLCRFDIVNPMNNFTTRVKLDYIDPDYDFLSLMKRHGNALKDFFSKIKIENQKEDLELNVLDIGIPDGYEIVYYRRSFRKEYIFQDNQLRISTEKVYHNTQYGTSNRRVEKDITDVFIWNSSLGEVFEYPDWDENVALTMIESQLKFQDDVMCLLK